MLSSDNYLLMLQEIKKIVRQVKIDLRRKLLGDLTKMTYGDDLHID